MTPDAIATAATGLVTTFAAAGAEGPEEGARLESFLPIEAVHGFGPVFLEQARQRTVGEQPAARLAGGAVVGFVVDVANPLHRRTTHGARLANRPCTAISLRKAVTFSGNPPPASRAQSLDP